MRRLKLLTLGLFFVEGGAVFGGDRSVPLLDSVDFNPTSCDGVPIELENIDGSENVNFEKEVLLPEDKEDGCGCSLCCTKDVPLQTIYRGFGRPKGEVLIELSYVDGSREACSVCLSRSVKDFNHLQESINFLRDDLVINRELASLYERNLLPGFASRAFVLAGLYQVRTELQAKLGLSKRQMSHLNSIAKRSNFAFEANFTCSLGRIEFTQDGRAVENVRGVRNLGDQYDKHDVISYVIASAFFHKVRQDLIVLQRKYYREYEFSVEAINDFLSECQNSFQSLN